MINKGYLSSIILIAILIGCIFISGCTQQTPKKEGEKHEAGFYTYENPQYGISIKYPDTWHKQEELLPNTVVVFAIESGQLKIFNGSLSIAVADVGSMSMEAFKDSHIENISLLYTDINISYVNSTTLAGSSAYKLICTYEQGVYTIKQMETWTIKNNRLYFLAYIIYEQYYDNYIDTIEQMINSFKII